MALLIEPETVLLGAVKQIKYELAHIRGGACQWKVNIEHTTAREARIFDLCVGLMVLEHIAEYLIRQEVA